LENVSVTLNVPEEPFGGLIYDKPRGHVMDTEFIFGVVNKRIDEALEIPMFVAVVRPDNWI
jgi:hypothetical protein